MGRIKDVTRSSMGERKLNTDMMIASNKDIPIDFKKVVQLMESTKERRWL